MQQPWKRAKRIRDAAATNRSGERKSGIPGLDDALQSGEHPARGAGRGRASTRKASERCGDRVVPYEIRGLEENESSLEASHPDERDANCGRASQSCRGRVHPR